MTEEKLYELLNEISDDHVQKAKRTKKVKKSFILKCAAAAACVCVVALWVFHIGIPSSDTVITASGLLTVTAYAESNEELVMREGIEMPTNFSWSLAMSSSPGLPLNLYADEYEDVKFEVWTDGGTLLLWESNAIEKIDGTFYAENGTTIYWSTAFNYEENRFEAYSKSISYIGIIIRENENIVGYAVVQIYTDDSEDGVLKTYFAKLLKSVSFPTVKGKYQNITSEYVMSEIEKVKKS